MHALAIFGITGRMGQSVLRAVRESPELVPSLLPVGDGLLCAVKR